MRHPDHFPEYSNEDPNSNLHDELVAIALGIDEGDYVDAARNAVVAGHIEAVAKAEARIFIINEHDMRDPSAYDAAAEQEAYKARRREIESILEIRPPEELERYFKAYSDELFKLDTEMDREDETD